jgi:TatD DNase family protein
MAERELPVTEILDYCFSGGLRACIDISISLENFDERAAWAERYDGLYLTAGLHPGSAGRTSLDSALPDLRERLQHPAVVALGEIGLDRPEERENRAEQYEFFEAQLNLSRELGVPVIIHNRDAEQEIYELVRKRPPVRESVMHCYSGSAAYARKFVDLGFAVSFAGNLTFKKGSAEIREAARQLPLETILLETDAPFLAPEPARGRPNHPAYIGHTYAFFADLRQRPTEEITETIAQNSTRIFGVPEPAAL